MQENLWISRMKRISFLTRHFRFSEPSERTRLKNLTISRTKVSWSRNLIRCMFQRTLSHFIHKMSWWSCWRVFQKNSLGCLTKTRKTIRGILRSWTRWYYTADPLSIRSPVVENQSMGRRPSLQVFPPLTYHLS